MERQINQLSNLEGEFYEFIYRIAEADPEWNRKVLAFYVPFFSGCRRVLDLGCGRGEFLDLLRENGIAGIGVDIDSEMIRACESKGLNVVKADLFEYLDHIYEDFDGIFCSNVIEHMDVGRVLHLFRLAYRALRPGGIFLVATPNPESLIVHLYEFWRDPTHVRMYNLPLLMFMMDYVGFRNISGGENPETQWVPSWHSNWEVGLNIRFQVSSPSTDRFQQSMSPYSRVNLLDISAMSRNRGKIRRLIYLLRRQVARFLVRVLFEEFFVINELLETAGIIKFREIYSLGQKI